MSIQTYAFFGLLDCIVWFKYWTWFLFPCLPCWTHMQVFVRWTCNCASATCVGAREHVHTWSRGVVPVLTDIFVRLPWELRTTAKPQHRHSLAQRKKKGTFLLSPCLTELCCFVWNIYLCFGMWRSLWFLSPLLLAIFTQKQSENAKLPLHWGAGLHNLGTSPTDFLETFWKYSDSVSVEME